MKKRAVKSNNRLVSTKKRRRFVDPATRQLILQTITGVGVFSVIALILTGVWHVSRLPALTLETITVEGGQTISHAQVQKAVADTLDGSYFGFIPKRFALTYPHDIVIEKVSAINRVKNPTITRVSGTELRVFVDEYIPYALWCKADNETDCFFIDKEGFAFAQAPVLSGGSLYRFYTLGDEPTIKKIFFDGRVLSEIVAIADALESEFNLPIAKIELDTVGDVFFQVVRGGEIKVTTNQSTVQTLENLELVLSADDFKNLKAGTFKYIDLRFGNKVFVNDTMLVEAATTTKPQVAAAMTSNESTTNTLESAIREVMQLTTTEVSMSAAEDDDEDMFLDEMLPQTDD